MTKEEKLEVAPLWERPLLTLQETAAYTGIGVDKLREFSEGEGSDLVLWVGSRRMFKRKKLEEYLEKNWSM